MGIKSTRQHFFRTARPFLALLLTAASVCLFAQTGTTEINNMDKPWSVGTYHGVFTPRNFGESLWRMPGDTESNRFQALTVSRKFAHWPDKHLSAEWEGIAAYHWGKHEKGRQTYPEFVASVNLRYHHFPWDRYLNTSVAVGEGISYAGKPPVREKQKDGETRRLLNYLMVELSFETPFDRNREIFYRIHHRSGVFKLFSKGGSNFYCIGLRYHFTATGRNSAKHQGQ